MVDLIKFGQNTGLIAFSVEFVVETLYFIRLSSRPSSHNNLLFGFSVGTRTNNLYFGCIFGPFFAFHLLKKVRKIYLSFSFLL